MKIDNKNYNYKEVIKMESPAPLSDGMAGSQWIYLPLIITIFGPLFYMMLRTCIADSGCIQLRKKCRFYMPQVQFDVHELLSIITIPLTNLGMTVTLTKNNVISITHKNVIYDVNFNNDNTFGIWWRKSIGRAFFELSGKITLYRKAVTSMGLIAYTVQQALEEIAKNKGAQA